MIGTHRNTNLFLNYTARVVANKPTYLHITEYIGETLHWLPLAERIIFKIIKLTHALVVGALPA